MSAPDDAGLIRLRQALRKLTVLWPAMYPDAPTAIRLGTIGRSRIQPLPIPVPVMPSADGTGMDVAKMLAQWALVVADDLDLHPTVRCSKPEWHGGLVPLPRGHYGPQQWVERVRVCGCGIAPKSTNLDHRLPATDTVAVVRFLTTHADYLATIDDAVDEIATAAAVVERIAEPPSPLEFVGQCDVCKGDLRSRDGGRALCRDCGNIVDADATRDRLVTESEQRIMPAAEIVTLAPRLWPDARVTHVHLHRWVKRGDLISPGQVMCDDGIMRPGYRVKDVAILAARHASRRSA